MQCFCRGQNVAVTPVAWVGWLEMMDVIVRRPRSFLEMPRATVHGPSAVLPGDLGFEDRGPRSLGLVKRVGG